MSKNTPSRDSKVLGEERFEPRPVVDHDLPNLLVRHHRGVGVGGGEEQQDALVRALTAEDAHLHVLLAGHESGDDHDVVPECERHGCDVLLREGLLELLAPEALFLVCHHP
ncbi:hypothetical protein ABC270_02505 [Curtobacterium sp. 1P10AnD]|uniref:hypothetical protein n=1 Tax=Curtobacterium sp. 1P10AnD TaxID=3132283 RepID=UPI0039A2E53B